MPQTLITEARHAMSALDWLTLDYDAELLRGVPVDRMGRYRHPRKGRAGSRLRFLYDAKVAAEHRVAAAQARLREAA